MFNYQSELNCPVSNLKGVGKKRAAVFAKLRVKTCFDLLCHFPVAYDDFSKFRFINDVVSGEKCCVKAKILEKTGVVKIKNLRMMKALAVDEHNSFFNLVFFNNVYFFNKLKLSEVYVFFGKIEKFGREVQMVAPQIVLKSEIGLVAKYALTAGLKNRIVADCVKQVLQSFKVAENLPQSVLVKFNLVSRHTAFFDVHFPKSQLCLELARRRLIFEELFFWQLSLKLLKKVKLVETKAVLKTTNLNEFFSALPFKLSNSQLNVLNECVADCKKNVAMNRLIQGDVGCGKTVIVQALCYLFAKSGFQVAVMAPTEILARQHFENFRLLFFKFNIEVGLLVGSLKKSAQVEVLSGLVSGTIKVLIGTHSLFGNCTKFKNLGLVVTDEQHRFGVLQRGSLEKKGNAAHVIIMSATPVPRTLAMVAFSDVDVSVVDQMPYGRAKTKTFHIPPSKRLRAFSFLVKEVKKGHQAYIVCPLIDCGVRKAVAVEPYFEKLKALKEFKGLKIAMLHGEQTSDQKANLMNSFKKGEVDVLVATSMVEVGIDNPNATVIIIENAELFGLASLHQLRGRVGRGKLDSFCILISEAKTDQAKERMKAMCSMQSGFDISRADLKLRGPGHFFGTLQHGAPDFKIADLVDNFELLRVCSKEAESFLNCCQSKNSNKGHRAVLARVAASIKAKKFIL